MNASVNIKECTTLRRERDQSWSILFSIIQMLFWFWLSQIDNPNVKQKKRLSNFFTAVYASEQEEQTGNGNA